MPTSGRHERQEVDRVRKRDEQQETPRRKKAKGKTKVKVLGKHCKPPVGFQGRCVYNPEGAKLGS